MTDDSLEALRRGSPGIPVVPDGALATPGANIRVLLADDQALIRSAVADLVAHEQGFAVVGQAANGHEAYQLTRAHRPDVVLMDVRMPVVDGIRATEMISADPDLATTRIIILTTFEDDGYVLHALRAGASGFIGKGADPAELMSAIRVVHRGEALLSPRATQTLINRYLNDPGTDHDTTHVPGHVTHPGTGASSAAVGPIDPIRDAGHSLPSLTSRETEVLRLVARGMSNDEIAEQLFISPHTAKTHVSRTMNKLGLRDRAQMVVLAYERGLTTS